MPITVPSTGGEALADFLRHGRVYHQETHQADNGTNTWKTVAQHAP
jgi:hypothetical protein